MSFDVLDASTTSPHMHSYEVMVSEWRTMIYIDNLFYIIEFPSDLSYPCSHIHLYQNHFTVPIKDLSSFFLRFDIYTSSLGSLFSRIASVPRISSIIVALSTGCPLAPSRRERICRSFNGRWTSSPHFLMILSSILILISHICIISDCCVRLSIACIRMSNSLSSNGFTR